MANSGKVLITGATGKVGGALLDNLGKTDIGLRALTRDESKAQALRERGVEAVLGDFLKPETLGPALEGVSTVFLLTPIHPQQAPQATNVIEAAKGSGKDPRIVRLSVHQASQEGPTRISRQHAEIEDELVSSGLPYTLLRPQSFMQNTLMAAPTVAAEGRIYQPMKEGRLGMIDARDIGEVAAKVLTEEGHEDKTYTLTGPAAISFHDVADALSEVLGKKVDYVSIPRKRRRKPCLAGASRSGWRMLLMSTRRPTARATATGRPTTPSGSRATPPPPTRSSPVTSSGCSAGMIRNPVDRS